FRSFLLASFKHFLAHERDRVRARKRGGGRKQVSLDFAAGESRYSLEPGHELTAEAMYERRWAVTLLDRVLARLREEFASAEKATEFEQLKVFLSGDTPNNPYRQVAEALASTEGAVKVAVHRLRRRFRDLVLEEIAQTVAEPEDVQDELRHLF